MNLAKTSAERWESLRKMDAVAQQETDERASGFIQQQAAVANATENLRLMVWLANWYKASPFDLHRPIRLGGERVIRTSEVPFGRAGSWRARHRRNRA